MRSFPGHFILQAEQPQFSQLFSLWGSFVLLILGSTSGLASSGPCISCAEGSSIRHSTVDGISPEESRAEQRRRIISLNLLPTLLVMQPRSTFWASGAPCWLIFSFLSTSTPKNFCAGLLSISSSSSLCLYQRPEPSAGPIMQFTWVHSSRFSRSILVAG